MSMASDDLLATGDPERDAMAVLERYWAYLAKVHRFQWTPSS